MFRTRLVLDVLINPRKSHGHRAWCRGARAVPPWACLPGWRLGPLHRVLPRIWPYLAKIQSSNNRLKYSARPITLAHDEILTNEFFRLKRGTLEMQITVLEYRASKSRNARARYWHILTYPFWIGSPLVESKPILKVGTSAGTMAGTHGRNAISF